jgi:hypothetical protein
VVLECCQFTADAWWLWNVITSVRICGGAGMSFHCGCVMALECYHFTANVRRRWNVVISVLMCSGSGKLSVQSGCVVTMECHLTIDVWCGNAGRLSLHCGRAVALNMYCQ